ncbi:MAG: 4Fe-4S dicluster domain-containing protein [Dehalococcoidales bacterium]|jgi:molybdopterin-containing oxidoreductase family iron-sulfur binding subunit|nr:hypothetical protein [Dehalococcoidales bacterium]MDP6222188.1 4Fe-4S dicluster domain-containing protein [Dehalococcoidales bacterium]MDP6646883.1 4Fe-4S dicluster domain-containing protein [Dehalococcoidales bacterium]MDP6738182.1 4Fe-4S dicluster domain-containing protein [Dehalococcoidales bacterium]MDP7309872.1 4Fe-4S dicluster domain-containing protein [Dehalococcoidales bacterium]|tara:strand:- start:1357 stop:2298 length:942 start_codon:yes stop_codon:yes gene_type:complete
MADKNKDLSRRGFIKKSLGLAGLLGVMYLPVPQLMKLRKDSIVGRGLTSKNPANQAQLEGKARAWGMVIDLKKCDGCVGIETPPQCTQACINGHYGPNGQQWIEVFEKELAGGGHYFMPVPCYQCENAPCANVCPVAATYHDEDGVVLIDHNRCIGCRMCMAACPYQRRFFNWGTPKLPAAAALSHYSPLYPVPAVKGTVIKCMFCAHFLHDGKLPYCVKGCPTKALYIGDLNEDIATNGAEVVQFSKFLDENSAYRYKEELGTQPRVWYLPGYGQLAGRTPRDHRPLMPPQWLWGDDDSNRRVGIWPWGEDF